MTKFYLNPMYLEKWLKQNKAVYTGDFFDGCLLDNFVVATKRGYAFIYEHYLNPNSSDYLVKFVPYKNGYEHGKEFDLLWSEWFSLEESATA